MSQQSGLVKRVHDRLMFVWSTSALSVKGVFEFSPGSPVVTFPNVETSGGCIRHQAWNFHSISIVQHLISDHTLKSYG